MTRSRGGFLLGAFLSLAVFAITIQAQESRFVPVEPHSGPLGISPSDPEVQRRLMDLLQQEKQAKPGNQRTIQAAFRRIAPFLPEIQAIFAAEGLPPEALWMGFPESKFLFGTTSGRQASGSYQFRPGTFEEECRSLPAPKPDPKLCEAWGGSFQPVRDPVFGARLAAQFLRKQRDKDYGGYLGTMRLALMAYNGGPVDVRICLRRVGSNPDSWQDFAECISTRKSPDAAQENLLYPYKVVAATILAGQPEDFGLYLPRYNVPPYVYIRTQGRSVRLDDLAQDVARLADRPQLMQQIKDWNPALFLYPDQECVCAPRDIGWGLRIPAEGGLAEEVRDVLLKSGDDPCCA